MEHREIEREQTVERYLAGRLGAEETARFEEHYLSCPECLEQLELSEAFRDGLRQAAAEDALRAAVTTQVGLAAWLGRATRSPRVGLLAAAGLLVMLLPLGLLLRQQGELAAARAPQANTVVLPLAPERSGPGEAPSARLTLPDSPGWIVLSLELADVSHESYRVRLVDAANLTLWTGEGLVPGHLDTLNISLHSSLLAEGDYALHVDGAAPGSDPGGDHRPVGRFSFRVLPGAR